MLRGDFPGAEGRAYTIISLEGAMSRGQMLEVVSSRKLTNTFCEKHEFVQVSVEVPTGDLRMSVTWPKNRRPSKLRIEQGLLPTVEIAASAIKQLPDGRYNYRHVVPRPALGETITLSWDW